MKLIDVINILDDGDEITVWDKDYDTEIYFCKDDNPDEWTKAINKIASELDVVKVGERAVVVNLGDLISKRLSILNKADLFIQCDIDSIMDDIESIFAGNVSENWMIKFADALTNKQDETYEVFIYDESVSFSNYNDHIYYDRESIHIIQYEISKNKSGIISKLRKLKNKYEGYTYGIWLNGSLIRGGIFDDLRISN